MSTSTNPSTSHTGCSSSTAGGTNGGPCGACKFLRRKCVEGCVFAPYFDSEHGATHFAAVHKVFGASNVSKLLVQVPVHKRLDAVVTVCYEAQARIRDPVYGCVSHLFALQQQVLNLQAELSYLQAHLATLESPPPPPPAMFAAANPPCFPANYDLSVLFDPTVQPSVWSIQPPPQNLDPIQFNGGTTETSPPQHGGDGDGGGGGAGDLHELARELLRRRNMTGSSEGSTDLP